jgi:hypothetical protein
MKRMNLEAETPLGSLARLYLKKTSSNAGILLDPETYTLEFYPAGYTQISKRDKVSRQIIYQKLWEKAVSDRQEDETYPLSQTKHVLKLVYDPYNSKDTNAVQILIGLPNSCDLDIDLGFIPKRISKVVRKNIDMFSGGRILKVRANWHKKYYTAKVILGYNDVFATTEDSYTERFIDMMDEI